MSSEIASRIKLFVPTFQIEDCISGIRECLEIGWTGSGFKTTEFETEWANYNNVEEMLFISSNTAGLDLALRGLKEFLQWEDGSEIITTPLTFVSTNHSILLNDLKPVFADIDESLCLDVDSVLNSITSKTKAIIYVGIGGNAANLQELRKICDARSILLIIDAAHMSGTKLNGQSFTAIGDVTVHSFQAVKNLPTADSGSIYVRDLKLREKIRKLSWLGISSDTFARSKSGSYKWKYEVESIGTKSNGNSIMASIALAQLKVLDNDNKTRFDVLKKYKHGIKPHPLITWIKFPPYVEPSYHLAQMRISNGCRDNLIDYLDKKGIDTGVHYRLNTRYPMYSNLNLNIPNSIKFESEIISLPLHLRLSETNIQFIINSINEFFGEINV